MIKDPWTQWEDGIFPYDALAAAGITPESSMKQVLEAAGDLIEQGLWTPEKRGSWDELRTVERRLSVDFFMLPMTAEDIVHSLADFSDETEVTLPVLDLSHLLHLDFSDLRRMAKDFRPVEVEEMRLERIADFDQSLEEILGRLEFDA